jgi:hypothetical protein
MGILPPRACGCGDLVWTKKGLTGGAGRGMMPDEGGFGMTTLTLEWWQILGWTAIWFIAGLVVGAAVAQIAAPHRD